jgi:hypothetical protein
MSAAVEKTLLPFLRLFMMAYAPSKRQKQQQNPVLNWFSLWPPPSLFFDKDDMGKSVNSWPCQSRFKGLNSSA